MTDHKKNLIELLSKDDVDVVYFEINNTHADRGNMRTGALEACLTGESNLIIKIKSKKQTEKYRRFINGEED